MTDRYTDLDDPGWLRLFEDVQTSWFRLETLQVYAVDYEDHGQADFRRTGLADDGPSSWRAMISRHRTAGRQLQRVHVVEDPITDYLRYELAIYELNRRAGEDIRLIPVAAGGWPPGIPQATDFWIFDDQDVWDMTYDQKGRFVGASRDTSKQHLQQCREWRDVAMAAAMPLDDYAVSRP